MGEIDKDVPGLFLPDTQMVIRIICGEVLDMLLEKNKCYGDSAINPTRIFSKVDPIEQINVRIDDKLNRLMQGTEYPGDDTEKDLIGYLILKRVAKRLEAYYEEHNGDGLKQVSEEQCPCGGEDKVLEGLGRTGLNSQPLDGVCKCGEKSTDVDDDDYEYAPTLQRNVFSDILAKPK